MVDRTRSLVKAKSMLKSKGRARAKTTVDSDVVRRGPKASDSEETTPSKRKASKAPARVAKQWSRPEEWVECWVELRKKKDAFGQDWAKWPQLPRRRATLLGSSLYAMRDEASAESGFWRGRRHECVGARNPVGHGDVHRHMDARAADANAPTRTATVVPPEWLLQRPRRADELIAKAVTVEQWLKETIFERRLKRECARGTTAAAEVATRVDALFASFDADGSGSLDAFEFKRLLSKLSPPDAEYSSVDVAWLVGVLDRDGGGSISLQELQHFVERPPRVGVSASVEFHGEQAEDLHTTLRRLYDPKGLAPKFHPMYTLKALLLRDSFKFLPQVRKLLDFLWKEIDLDKSGRIEEGEYVAMHRSMCTVMLDLKRMDAASLGAIGGGPINDEVHLKLALDDWAIDHQGFSFLDYNRFVSCWFQVADQFTEKIVASEYTAFLTKMTNKLYPPPDFARLEEERLGREREQAEREAAAADAAASSSLSLP
mmetsp:Transcript_13805/g.48999  ORF Transcript_13805/g.48999 Transcript_13805/m.48999 type:complete len:487 (+) Transcript_13805:137-1597(+)